jgi:hypothetical protein
MQLTRRKFFAVLGGMAAAVGLPGVSYRSGTRRLTATEVLNSQREKIWGRSGLDTELAALKAHNRAFVGALRGKDYFDAYARIMAEKIDREMLGLRGSE